MVEIGAVDWLILSLWVVSFSILLYIYKKFNPSPLDKGLFLAFFLKLAGGIAFALVYHFYYGGGDTSYYFDGADKLSTILFASPNSYFRLLFSTCDEAQHILRQLNQVIYYSRSDEEWFMIRLISPLTILGLKSILGTTFFMALISFSAAWKLFTVMDRILPNRKKLLFAINFLIPSVVFWGSGIMKDTVTQACFSFVIAWFYELFFEKKISFSKIFFGLLFMFIIYKLKAYILLNLFPWFFASLFLLFLQKRPSLFLKVISVPFLLIIVSSTGAVISNYVMQNSAEYNSDRFFKNMEGFHEWHTQLGGSSYTLGEMEYTITGIIKKAPAAINVTLFRPYLWECNTAFMYLNALESLGLLFLTIVVVLRTRMRGLQALFSSAYLTGGFLFCITFSFAIGITAYNFGALDRFKIPVLGVFLFVLLYVTVQVNEKRFESNV